MPPIPGTTGAPGAAGPPLFALDHVRVEHDGHVLLRDVTVALPDGGVTVLVGPSGSGKSTLLRLCNRLEVPSAGRLAFRGHDLLALDPLRLRRSVGMIFQRPTPFPGTVRENLAVAVPGVGDERARAALERVGLAAEFLEREATELSGGEAQRACLARTLVTEPEVLLMDEPTSALDLEPRRALEELARGLAADGVPVLWVTHDLDQMRRLADWVVELREGRVERSGPAADHAEEGDRAPR